MTSPIKKVEVGYRERGLVSLVLITDTEEVRIEGDGESKHTDTFEVVEGIEKVVQFKVRLAQNLITGISFGCLSSAEILRLKGQ